MRLTDIGFGTGDISDRSRALRALPLNDDPAHAGGPRRHRDDYRQPLPADAAGAAGGTRILANRCATPSRDYAFCEPSLVESHFDPDAPLEGRDMLLVLHVFALRIDAGVRANGAHEGGPHPRRS